MNNNGIEIKSDRDAPVVRTTTFLLWVVVIFFAVITWAVLAIVNQFFPANGTLALAISILVDIIFGLLLLKIV